MEISSSYWVYLKNRAKRLQYSRERYEKVERPARLAARKVPGTMSAKPRVYS